MGETIGAEVPANLKERIDEYREPDESRSAAVERLIRDGLEDDPDDGLTPVAPLLIFGALTLGIAMEPVASSEFLISVAAGAFVLAVVIDRGILT